jgi:hypothetical protein
MNPKTNFGSVAWCRHPAVGSDDSWKQQQHGVTYYLPKSFAFEIPTIQPLHLQIIVWHASQENQEYYKQIRTVWLSWSRFGTDGGLSPVKSNIVEAGINRD